MYTKEMLESIKKVEANREANAALEPRRMTAEEKDALLDGYRVLKSLLLGKVNNLNFFWTMERYGSIVLMILVVFNVLTPVLNWGVNGILNFMLNTSLHIFGLA